MQRRLVHLAALSTLGLAALGLHITAAGQTPLKIVVGFPPGGSADTLARIMAEALESDFKTIVVENRPGAGGRIALNQVKRAPADGQTVVILPSGPMVLFPHAYKKLDYDPVTDFTPISLLARFQFGVVAGPASTSKSLQNMISKAKNQPGTLSYGTPGQGTLPHFLGVLFEQNAGAKLNHIPFQGGGPANAALLGGHIQYKFDVVSETAELHRTGRVRILAVTGAKRDPQVPEVPTLKESGVDMDATAWFAMYAPANLSTDARQRLEAGVRRAVQRPEVKARLEALGYEVVGSTGAELAAAQRADLQRWETPIRSTGIQLD